MWTGHPCVLFIPSPKNLSTCSWTWKGSLLLFALRKSCKGPREHIPPAVHRIKKSKYFTKLSSWWPRDTFCITSCNIDYQGSVLDTKMFVFSFFFFSFSAHSRATLCLPLNNLTNTWLEKDPLENTLFCFFCVCLLFLV